MTDDILEEFRTAYYNSITDLQEEKDILKALPTPEFQNFFPLMEGLISKLVEEYYEFQSFADDPDILEELEGLKKKINICQKK